MTSGHPYKSVAKRTITIAASVLAIDAISKVAARLLAARDYGHGIILPIQNPDFSLGLASAPHPTMLILSTVGIVLFGSYTAWAVTRRAVPAWVPGLLIGGAAGNLSDRVLFGAVHDWLDLGRVIINLADVSVLVGLLAFGASLALSKHRRSSLLRTS